MKGKQNMKSRIYPFYFVIGTLCLYLLLFVVPSIMGLFYSFTDWSSYSEEINYIGLENFKIIFSPEEHYFSALSNTVWFTVATTILKTGLGIVFALILNEGVLFRNFHRGLIFMPSILSFIIVGLIFKSILNPETGLLNVFLNRIGLSFLAKQWLVDLKYAFNSIIAVDTWKGLGYIMTIIIAGLQSIPPEYYEAADIDGAHYFSKLRYVTLPLLKPAITITIVLNVLYGLKIFDTVYVLTNGGPGYATEVLYTSVFREFGLGRYGVGTSMSTVLFVMMSVIGYFTVKLLDRKEVEF
jgi:raffinose/stachyose/melibiose transport system permease protein